MRCRFFRCYFITLARGSTGNHGIIKIVNSVYVKRSQLYYWTAVFLLLMMSSLSGHRGSVLLQSSQERYWVEHIHRHNTSLAYFTIVHKQNICHVHNNMHSHASAYLQILKSTCLCFWGQIRILIWSGAVWRGLHCLTLEHILFSQPALLDVIFPSFLRSAWLPCLGLWSVFDLNSMQIRTRQVDFYLIGTAFSMLPPQ